MTGQFLGGALVGPYAFHVFGILPPGVGPYDQAVNGFHFFVFVFLGMVAFGIGEELHLSRLRRVGRAAILIGLIHGTFTFALLGGAFYLLTDMGLLRSLLMGVIAVASAPAVAFVLMNRLRIEGRLRQMMGGLVVLTDLAEIVAFSVLVQVAEVSLREGGGGAAPVLGTVAWEIGAALLLGGGIFVALRMLVRREAGMLEDTETEVVGDASESNFLHRMLAEHPSPSAEILLVVLGTVSLGAGASYALGLPFLITATAAGFLVPTLHSQAVFDSLKIETITPVFTLGFFARVARRSASRPGASRRWAWRRSTRPRGRRARSSAPASAAASCARTARRRPACRV